MLNEDELRDAVLLVFANKQDLPFRCTRGQSPVYSSTVAKSSIMIRKFLQHSGWPGLFCGARRRVEIDTDVEFKGYHPTWTWPSSSSSYALAFPCASSSS